MSSAADFTSEAFVGRVDARRRDANSDLIGITGGLNLIVAAIVYWNTVYLEQAVATLRAAGLEIPDELLQHLSPLTWEQIVLTGEYRWMADVARRPRQRRELRATGETTAPLVGRGTLLDRIPAMITSSRPH